MGANLDITDKLQNYINKFGLKLNPIQQEIIDYNKTLGDIKRMQIDPTQCHFLHLIIKISNIKNVLEIGTYTGYSTLCIAKGLNPVGMIHTIDKNEELLQIQNKYFEKSGLRNQIKQYTGDAIAIIPKLKFDFDMVFLDADKENYVKYLELISPILKTGGVLLTDNVLWHGKIVESSKNQDRVTRLIDNFNKEIIEDKSLKTVMLPIRDGISLTLKL